MLFTEDRDNATIQAALKAGVSAYIVAGMQADRLQPILDVAVARFEQDRALREELRDAQTKLAERKVIERAKGILMEQKGVGEEEAYRLMRKLAMDRNRSCSRSRSRSSTSRICSVNARRSVLATLVQQRGSCTRVVQCSIADEPHESQRANRSQSST